MDKKTIIESLLLISDRPLSIDLIAKKIDSSKKETKELIKEIQDKFNTENSGIHIAESWGKIQFTTNPKCEAIVKEFVKEEINSNLSDASLETLTIIAYRGPITRSEIEQIRGVNCSVILKNLMIKGLIESEFNKEKITDEYNITVDFLKYLGINNSSELPNYEQLNSNEIIDTILNQNQNE
ncbi:MAG TPA: SMC-Scp complex subunit ScpB [bacterium]|jgi:segregation and condensation protein B|nr:SMC-Scp complex subunit ScpB [bacterium]HOG37889.1 SMC-Scp complex subunit ScpB [bacterium]HQI03105.1 SMC-Scp complex subunit ScpB [bacterium]